MSPILRWFVAAVALACSAAVVCAQCGLQWLPGDPIAMPRGVVRATTIWDPDGAGPLPTVLVAVGSFWVGAELCDVAMFDGSNWTSLGSPLGTASGSVGAVTVYNNELVVACSGHFFSQVCRRTGSTWTTIGTAGGVPDIRAMAVFNGELVVAGQFLTMAGFNTNNIARWNGTSWLPCGSGVSGAVHALAVYTFGFQSALYVGGAFTSAGGAAVSNLAVWTGAAWGTVGGCDAEVRALGVRLTAAVTTSHLFVGGAFTTAGGVAADRVARFNAATSTWSALGTLPGTSPCARLLVRPTGLTSYELVASRDNETQLSSWNGTVWNNLGPTLQSAYSATGLFEGVEIAAIAWYGGRYIATLQTQHGVNGGVFAFDGAAWQTVDGAGIDRAVATVAATATDLVIGGSFRSISGVPMNGIARGGPGAWQALGSGVTAGKGGVGAVVVLPNGDVVAGGSFWVADGGAADNIARWDGTAWHPLGTGMNGSVLALEVMPDGSVVAGGAFTIAGGVLARGIARWNGTAWSSLDTGCNGTVTALRVLHDGSLAVGGTFTQVGSAPIAAERIALWSGSVWQSMWSGFDDMVRAIVEQPNGDLVVAGQFLYSAGGLVQGLARWHGGGWSALLGTGTLQGPMYALTVLPDGDVVVGLRATAVPAGSGPIECLARVHGTAVQALGMQPASGLSSLDEVHAITVTPAGDIVAAGYFQDVAGLVSANVARLVPICPASAVPVGSGCAGSGGVNTLIARTLPWDGSTLRTRATGMPAQGVALVLFGFTSIAVPLASLLPEGAPGCDLLTTPDVLLVGVPAAGALDTAIFVAPTPSLVGATFFHQVIPLQGFGVGPLTITATNGLAFVGGTY